MRTALIHPSALSPQEYEIYSPLIQLLTDEIDLQYHAGVDSLRSLILFDWLREYLVDDLERTCEVQILSFFKSLTSTSPSSWILLALLRLISHSKTSQHLARDHLFIQTIPVELHSIQVKPSITSSSSSWTNPFTRSVTPSSPKASPSKDLSSRLSAPPLPLKLRSTSGGWTNSSPDSSIHSTPSVPPRPSNHSSSKSVSSSINNSPFKTRISLPNLSNDSTNISSIGSSWNNNNNNNNTPISPPLSQRSNPNSPIIPQPSLSSSTSTTSSNTKPPLPPRKISINYGKPLPPRTKSISDSTSSVLQTSKTISIISGSLNSPDVPILEAPIRNKLSGTSHIGLDTQLRSSEEERISSSSTTRNRRSDSINSNSSLNLLGVNYAAIQQARSTTPPLIIPSKSPLSSPGIGSISAFGGKSFAGLGGVPESPSTNFDFNEIIPPSPTPSLNVSKSNLIFKSKSKESSPTTLSPFRSPPPRRIDLPQVNQNVSPTLKHSTTFTTISSPISKIPASNLNRSKTVGSKPSSSSSLTSNKSPPLPPPKRIKPESSEEIVTNPFLGSITLSSPATFVIPPSVNYNETVNTIGVNLSRRLSTTSSNTSSSKNKITSTVVGELIQSGTEKFKEVKEGLMENVKLHSNSTNTTTTMENQQQKKKGGSINRRNIIVMSSSSDSDAETRDEQVGLFRSGSGNRRGRIEDDSDEEDRRGEVEEEEEEEEEEEGFSGNDLDDQDGTEKYESLGNSRREVRREVSGREEGWIGLS